jgi:endonuclease/exonuclease/phosphatase family metal-dependent hydrolase
VHDGADGVCGFAARRTWFICLHLLRELELRYEGDTVIVSQSSSRFFGPVPTKRACERLFGAHSGQRLRGTLGGFRVRFVTYNIQYGRGRDGCFDLPRIAAELRGADVIALQEVERYWQRSGLQDQPAELARLLGFTHWVYGAGIDLHLETLPPAAPAGARRQFGNMLLARTPILYSRNHLLPKYASNGPMSLQRSALEAVIGTRSGAIRVVSLHLTHLSSQTRLPQIEQLLSLHTIACREGAPLTCGAIKAEWVDERLPVAMPREAVLMGDFNMEADSEEYQRICGPVSVYGGRICNPEGFVDAWVVSGHGEDEGATADIKGRPARIDYCFVSAALASGIGTVSIDSAARGSDHQPLWMELVP